LVGRTPEYFFILPPGFSPSLTLQLRLPPTIIHNTKAIRTEYAKMKWADPEINLPAIEEAELRANQPRKSDEQLAREYAEMIDQIYLNTEAMDLSACPPDRRLIRGDREAWVYEHGNIAELVFVK